MWLVWTLYNLLSLIPTVRSLHKQLLIRCLLIASYPGHSQILSRSRGEKSGEGLGSLLCHGPEMVDSVRTVFIQVHQNATIFFSIKHAIIEDISHCVP